MGSDNDRHRYHHRRHRRRSYPFHHLHLASIMTTAILTTIESLELGKLLRGLRSDLELTQTDLVEMLCRVRGVSQSWLSNVERGYSLPTAGQLEHLLGTYRPTADQCQRARDLVAAEVLR